MNRDELIKECADVCCWKCDYIAGQSIAADILDRILPQDITPHSLLECMPKLSEEPVHMISVHSDEYEDYYDRHGTVGADDAGWVFREIMRLIDYGHFWPYLRNIVFHSCIDVRERHIPDGPSKKMVEAFSESGVHSSVCNPEITAVISCVLSAYDSDVFYADVTFEYLCDAVSKVIGE